MCLFCNDEIYVMGKDYACLRSNGKELFDKLNNKFMTFIDSFDYETYHVPSLIDGTYLEKCGYFESFPDQLNVVGSINENSINKIMEGNKIENNCIKLDNLFLNPAACLPIYPMFENQKIEKNMTITTLAEVYRYEGVRAKDLKRLRNFTVREIVFIGDKEFVVDSLNVIKGKALEFAKEICENAHIEISHDNFFRTRKNLIKARVQEVNSLKYELRMPVDESDLAISSFNYHNDHFSKVYHFNKNNVVTGCVGFGMERWMLACLKNRIPEF